MKNILTTIAICLAATGCASIISGQSQNVSINTPEGTNYVIKDRNGSNITTGTGPGVVSLYRGYGYFKTANYQVSFKKAGYKPKIIDIVPDFNAWYLGNLLLPGGFWGMLIIDPATGAMYKLKPNEINAELEPTGEDIELLNRQAAAIKRAQNFKVSKNDYTARQIALGKKCDQLASPEVTTENYIETLRFECKDGRSIEVTCKSEHCQ